MTDALLSPLSSVGDVSFLVDDIYGSGSIDDCTVSGNVPQALELNTFDENDGEVHASGLLSPTGIKSKSGGRNKGRPMKPVGSTTSAGCRSIIQCTICSKTFNNSSALAKHKLIHSDERKYACNMCSKAFKRQDHLNGHMMTHYSKKPYECKYIGCDKSYCDARSLRRHLENYHQQMFSAVESGSSAANSDSGTLTPASAPPEGTGGMPVFKFDAQYLQSVQSSLSSDSCGDVLTPSGNWPAGYNPFDAPKPVKCTVCDRRFRNLPALNGHMRLHGGYMKKEHVEVKPEVVAKADVLNISANHQTDTSSLTDCHNSLKSLTGKDVSNTMHTNDRFTKHEPDMDQQSSAFGIAVDDCKANAGTDCQTASLFVHGWLDDKPKADSSGALMAGGGMIKLESGEVGQQNISNNMDFTALFMGANEEFFGNDLSLASSNADEVPNSNHMITTVAGMSMDNLTSQQHMVVDDDVAQFGSQFNFGIDQHSLVSEEVSAAYHTASLQSPAEVMSNASVMFSTGCSRNQSFSDTVEPATSGFPSGILVSDQAVFTQAISSCTNINSYSLQSLHHTQAAEPQGLPPQYGSFFQYGTCEPQDSSVNLTPASRVDHDLLYTSAHNQVTAAVDSRDNYNPACLPPTPKTPVLSAMNKLQQMNLRTPRTPYSPSTPNRASRFQFPSAASDLSGQAVHGYQKPAGFHPYVPALPQQGSSNSHFINQRFIQDRNRFRQQHEIIQAQHEIDQQVQQLHQKDFIRKQQQQQTMHVIAAQPPQDPSSLFSSPAPFLETKTAPRSDEDYSMMLNDQQVLVSPGMPANRSSGSLSVTPDMRSAYVPEKLPDDLSVSASSELADDVLAASKMKRKHKPEPLVIPPDVNNFGHMAPATAGGRLSWESPRLGGVPCSSSQPSLSVPPYTESSMITLGCGISGSSWVQLNMQCGLQPAQQHSEPSYWPSC